MAGIQDDIGIGDCGSSGAENGIITFAVWHGTKDEREVEEMLRIEKDVAKVGTVVGSSISHCHRSFDRSQSSCGFATLASRLRYLPPHALQPCKQLKYVFLSSARMEHRDSSSISMRACLLPESLARVMEICKA